MIQKQAIRNSVIKHFKLYRFLILIKRMAVNVGMAAVASFCLHFIFGSEKDRTMVRLRNAVVVQTFGAHHNIHEQSVSAMKRARERVRV